MVDRQRAGDGVLGQIGVLIFIDEDEAVALVEGLAEFGVVSQQAGDVQEQVVEIGGVGGGQLGLVGRIDLLDGGSHGVARPRLVLFRR